MPHKACSEIPSMDSVVFNRAGVEHPLKNLDSKKANGPGKLPITLLKITARNVDNGDQMDMLILVFSKAFDKVLHRCLLSKLQFYGIQGKTLAWIESWLANRSQSVIVDGIC